MSPEFQIESFFSHANPDRIIFNGLVNKGGIEEGTTLLLGKHVKIIPERTDWDIRHSRLPNSLEAGTSGEEQVAKCT